MWRWKIDHPGDGDRADRAALRDEQDQRQGELDHRPRWAARRADRRGQQVLGVVAVEPRLRLPRAVPGRVADHHRDHEREVVVELRGRRAPPDADEDELGGDDHVRRAGRGRRSAGCRRSRPARRGTGPCRAGRAAPRKAEQRRRPRPGRGGRRQVAVVGRRRRAAGRAPSASSARVEADVERACAVLPRVSGTLSGQGGSRDRPGPQPVEDAADHRREAQGQRQRAGAEAEDLPEHRPDDRLLEDDRLASTSRRGRRARRGPGSSPRSAAGRRRRRRPA